jgi:YfiH family protein
VIEQQHEGVRYFQFEHFAQCAGVVQAVFSRQGGVSEPPFASLNTGYSSGDERSRVRANREMLSKALGCPNWPMATSWIVHGNEVIEVGAEWKDDHRELDDPGPRRRGDALITREPEVFLLISYADCLPLLLYDPVRHVAGIAHAGWRGTAGGVAGEAVRALARHFGSRPADVLVGMAPSIGPCCYEVGPDVLEQFERTPAIAETATFLPHVAGRSDRWMLDLRETNRRQLLAAGIRPEHLEAMPLCTSCRTDLFYSYRREQGKTGRFAVLMGLSPQKRQS